MKILIISDNHGKTSVIEKVFTKVGSIDLMVHLGDFDGSYQYIKAISPCEVEFVAGNNDFFVDLPSEKIINIGKYRVMITHGHRYGVSYNTKKLIDIAKKSKVDIIMYGHTHIPKIELLENIWVINPGSISLPRQRNGEFSYIVMEIDTKKEINFTLNYIK